MHDDEVVGTRVGGLGKNGFLERRGLADQDSAIGPSATRNQEWAWMKMARHLLKVKGIWVYEKMYVDGMICSFFFFSFSFCHVGYLDE
jgi:hypothetical protein